MSTVFPTVLAGVSVFVIGQLLIKFLLDPLQEYFRLKGDIADALIYYAHVYSNPGVGSDELMREAHECLRKHASSLLSRKGAIPFYQFWAKIGLLPVREQILFAHVNLIGLSNGLFRNDRESIVHNDTRVSHIVNALGLDIGR